MHAERDYVGSMIGRDMARIPSACQSHKRCSLLPMPKEPCPTNLQCYVLALGKCSHELAPSHAEWKFGQYIHFFLPLSGINKVTQPRGTCVKIDCECRLFLSFSLSLTLLPISKSPLLPPRHDRINTTFPRLQSF